MGVDSNRNAVKNVKTNMARLNSPSIEQNSLNLQLIMERKELRWLFHASHLIISGLNIWTPDGGLPLLELPLMQWSKMRS